MCDHLIIFMHPVMSPSPYVTTQHQSGLDKFHSYFRSAHLESVPIELFSMTQC